MRTATEEEKQIYGKKKQLGSHNSLVVSINTIECYHALPKNCKKLTEYTQNLIFLARNWPYLSLMKSNRHKTIKIVAIGHIGPNFRFSAMSDKVEFFHKIRHFCKNVT